MTKPIPFTAASLARAIRGIEKAGIFAVGVRPDGTLIIVDKPVDVASLVPVEPQSSPAPARRMMDYFNGGLQMGGQVRMSISPEAPLSDARMGGDAGHFPSN